MNWGKSCSPVERKDCLLVWVLLPLTQSQLIPCLGISSVVEMPPVRVVF